MPIFAFNYPPDPISISLDAHWTKAGPFKASRAFLTGPDTLPCPLRHTAALRGAILHLSLGPFCLFYPPCVPLGVINLPLHHFSLSMGANLTLGVPLTPSHASSMGSKAPFHPALLAGPSLRWAIPHTSLQVCFACHQLHARPCLQLSSGSF